MNANEMSYQFDVLFDKIASFSSPGYTAKEKSVFLSKAQRILIDKLGPAESIEKNRSGLDNITRVTDISTQSVVQNTGKPNGVRYDLPSDFMYPVTEEVTIGHTNECFDSKRIMVIPKRKDEYVLQIHNPFKKPQVIGSDYDCAWRLSFNDNTNGIKRVELITDGVFTISTYHLTYFKTPVDIVPLLSGDTSTSAQVDCELGEVLHREIVETAIRIADGAIGSQSYQIKLNEEKINN